MTEAEDPSRDRLKHHFAQRVIHQARQILEVWQRLQQSEWSVADMEELSEANQRLLRFAERFEIYACGVELANGFGELTDPDIQRSRFEAEMDEKQRVYGERYPIDADFLAALAVMPPASGVALGFDRLVMLATGAQRIDQVIWTPVAETGGQI